MAITVNDLKLFESEMMTNFSDGGGAMTNNVIIDGASNNIFPDVTEQSRVYGHVEERKVFMGVRSQNNDAIYAAMSYISKLPKDEKINVNLAKSNVWFDERGNRVIKEKTSIERTVYPIVNHPETTVTSDAVLVYQDLSHHSFLYNKLQFPVSYGCGYLSDNQSFEVYLGSAVAESKMILVFGTDGFGTSSNGHPPSDRLAGFLQIIRFFKGNKFYLKNKSSGTNEEIEVADVNFLDYSDSTIDQTIEGVNTVSYLTNPLTGKKWAARLTLQTALQNTYSSAVFDDKNTWVGSKSMTDFHAVITSKTTTVTPEYTTQEPDTFKTITGKKFYTSVKITAQVSSGMVNIPIQENTNVVIPLLNGIVLDDSQLGIKQSDFPLILIEKEVIQSHVLGQLVVLPESDIISAELFYKSQGVWNNYSTSSYIVNTTNGTIEITNTYSESLFLSGLKVRYKKNYPYNAFNSGDIVIILNDKETTGTYTNSQTVTLTRTNLSKVTVRDAANNLVDTSKFTVDLNAGSVTFTNVSGLSQPLTITDRIEDLGLVKSVTDTTLTLNNAITHTYPVEGTIVANCLLHGTLQSTVTRPFDQQTWTNVWQSTAIGSTVSAEYNFTNYPISVLNLSSITERWVIIFKSSTTFDLIGENLGLIINNGSTATDLAPINPYTNQPYFVLPFEGFGGGWSAGNCLRFDTTAAAAPFWVLQTISQGQATDPNFDFAIEIRGEIDAA